jgi:hypothetical protein
METRRIWLNWVRKKRIFDSKKEDRVLAAGHQCRVNRVGLGSPQSIKSGIKAGCLKNGM